MLLSQILACTIIHGKKIKKSHRTNKFKTSTSTWKDKF